MLNAQNNLGYTALMLAILHNKKSAYTLLLAQKEIDISIQNYDGDTALHFAIHLEDEFLISKLLKKGSDPNVESHSNGNAFLQAFRAEASLSIIKIFLDIPKINIYSTNRRGNNFFHFLKNRKDAHTILHYLLNEKKLKIRSILFRTSL